MRIFLSYRQDDAGSDALLLGKLLAQELGPDAIFLDVLNIPFGVDLKRVISNEVATCNVLLALIGRQWLNARGSRRHRRIDNPEDYVRLEIGTALSRDIPVIPILLRGAKIPPANRLPSDLQDLSSRIGLEIRQSTFDLDGSRLARELKAMQLALHERDNANVPAREPIANSVTPATQKPPQSIQIETALPTAVISTGQDKPLFLSIFFIALGGAGFMRVVAEFLFVLESRSTDIYASLFDTNWIVASEAISGWQLALGTAAMILAGLSQFWNRLPIITTMITCALSFFTDVVVSTSMYFINTYRTSAGTIVAPNALHDAHKYDQLFGQSVFTGTFCLSMFLYLVGFKFRKGGLRAYGVVLFLIVVVSSLAIFLGK